jgi:hypothetical protein
VTGRSEGEYSSYDFATVKYDSSGNEIWVTRYGGYDWDVASAIAVDDSGYVYVSGSIYAPFPYYDFATIKYIQSYHPTVTAPDSAKFFCQGPDTIRFRVTATDQDPGDIIELSGPGIPVPVEGVSPVHADVQLYISSGGTYSYVYEANSRGLTDYDTATWTVSFNYLSPNSFSLLSPPDNDTVFYVVTFSWEDKGDYDSYDTVRYDLYISTSPVFHPDSTIIHDSLLTNQLTDSLEIEKYYWKVRAYDRCELEVWSTQTWTLTTIPVIHGDANGDGEIEVGDVVVLIDYLYREGDPPDPFLSGDATCDGDVSVDDVVYLISYLFREGPPPEC